MIFYKRLNSRVSLRLSGKDPSCLGMINNQSLIVSAILQTMTLPAPVKPLKKTLSLIFADPPEEEVHL
jgi:hypothetical protein